MKRKNRFSFLQKAPDRFRSDAIRGYSPDEFAVKSDEPLIDRTGGRYGEGIIRGVSLASRGPAKGHGAWLDGIFLKQIHDGLDSENGLKARFTHPDMSGDALGTYVGKYFEPRIEGDQIFADLHFAAAGHRAPDGSDYAEYLMLMAENDPDMFGLSIVFTRDDIAMSEFRNSHRNEEGVFRSPDEKNTDNFPHVRLSKLHAADAVDTPAANEGLFKNGDLLKECNEMFSYALGLSDERPAMAMFDADPDRVRSYVARFLTNRGLELVDVKQKEKTEFSALDYIKNNLWK